MSERHDPQPRTITFGHYAAAVLPAFYIALAAVDALAYQAVAGIVACIALMGILLFSWRAEGRHNQTLCARCAHEVPLDGSSRADQWRRWLRLHHVMQVPAVRWGMVAVMSVGAVLSEPTSGATYGVLAALSLPIARSEFTHRRLSLWCPWCRDDDDGFDDVPVPDPVDVGTGDVR